MHVVFRPNKHHPSEPFVCLNKTPHYNDTLKKESVKCQQLADLHELSMGEVVPGVNLKDQDVVDPR